MAFTLFSSGVAVAAEPTVFYGFARDLDSGAYLYTERHEQVLRDGRWVRGSIVYFDRDGKEIGRKELDFTEHPYVPVYHLELASGYEEGIESLADGQIRMFRRDAGAEARETGSTRLRDDHAADSGFHSLIYDHLDDIIEGSNRNFRFTVAGNLGTYRFRVRKSGETTFEGEPAVVLTAEPSTLLRLVAPSLELLYSPEDRRLLEYRGISNVHDPDTGKPYPNARISYSRDVPDEARKVPELADR